MDSSENTLLRFKIFMKNKLINELIRVAVFYSGKAILENNPKITRALTGYSSVLYKTAWI